MYRKVTAYLSPSVASNSLSVPLFNTIAVFDDTELNDLTAIANSGCEASCRNDKLISEATIVFQIST